AVLRASAPAAVAALLATMVQMGLLGALITFAGQPLFAPHLTTTAAWGLTPLADQQLAGLIMWAPAAGVYLLSALVLLGRWLGAEGVAGAPARCSAASAAGRAATPASAATRRSARRSTGPSPPWWRSSCGGAGAPVVCRSATTR